MQSGHGRSADIWSVGCTVIEMMTGKPPYSEFPTQVSVLFHIANTQEPPEMPSHASEECHDFLQKCFQRNPRDRSTAVALLQHPFVMRGLDSPGPHTHWGGAESSAQLDNKSGAAPTIEGDSLPTLQLPASEAPPESPTRARGSLVTLSV